MSPPQHCIFSKQPGAWWRTGGPLLRHLILLTALGCQEAPGATAAGDPPSDDVQPQLEFSLSPDHFTTRAGVYPLVGVTFLSPGGLPEGVTFEFQPALNDVSVQRVEAADADGALELSIMVQSGAPLGEHSLELVGAAPGLPPGHAPFTLVIQEP